MVELFLDTSNTIAHVAIIKNNTIVAHRKEVSGNTLSISLLEMIDNLFISINMDISEVDKIYVVNGPGSFTGIRVGVSVAKTIAWALNKDIIVLSELEVMATTKFESDLAISIIDARRKASFNGIYNSNLDIIVEDKYSNNSDIVKYIPDNKTFTYISYTEIEGIETIYPEIDIVKIVEKYRNFPNINPHKVNPNYLKLTEAEENLEQI